MELAESAGGIIVNADGHVVIVTQRDGSWSLPKGHIDPGENPFQAALREIHEETGLTSLTLVNRLGWHDRTARNEPAGYKRVHLFLFTSTQATLAPVDPHNQVARWAPLDEAVALIRNTGDAERLRGAAADVARAAARLRGPRERTL